MSFPHPKQTTRYSRNDKAAKAGFHLAGAPCTGPYHLKSSTTKLILISIQTDTTSQAATKNMKKGKGTQICPKGYVFEKGKGRRAKRAPKITLY